MTHHATTDPKTERLRQQAVIGVTDLATQLAHRMRASPAEVLDALRRATAPLPVSDEVLQANVDQMLQDALQAAEAQGRTVTVHEAERIADNILDACAVAGVAPSRVRRILDTTRP